MRPSPPPSSKQQETRQRQLDSLRRMEDRLKSLAEEEQRKAREKERDRAAKAKDHAHAALAPPQPGEERQQGRAKIIRCQCESDLSRDPGTRTSFHLAFGLFINSLRICSSYLGHEISNY